MVRGLLDGLQDPVVLAEIDRRTRVIDRIAEQMGVNRTEAREMLSQFEADTHTEGCELH
jgi:hypothetical protein